MSQVYTVPDLQYPYSALEPIVSSDIMKLHHQKHHQTYVDKLNTALAKYKNAENKTLKDLLTTPNIPSVIRNNGGVHYNHSLFWRWMSPDGGGEPSGELLTLLETKYGSFQGFVDQFSNAGEGLFGSGWTWLLSDMQIVTTANQDVPFTTNSSVTPVLGLDVWEHAYYLDYKNDRSEYIKKWWNVVNWSTVAELYQESLKQ